MLFEPVKIGKLTLRNRSIRAAAFESMAPGNRPSQQLVDYHCSVAAGGIGMTTVAYASVSRNGLSFEKQLWMRPEIVPELKAMTDSIHVCGAAAGIQLGHCGNMSKSSVAGETPISASGGFNIYSPTFVRKMTRKDIDQIVSDFGNAVLLAKEAGFDAVEIHAGHGYLISQFLSPYTNRRNDEFGGSLDNRMRFMRMVFAKVIEVAGDDITVIAKMNMRDGFKGGMDINESIEVAKELEHIGVEGIVLSGGFVSKAPMYVMRGEMPIKTMTHYMKCWWLKWGVRLAGRFMIPKEKFSEIYFFEDALKFRKEINIPLIYVGGLLSRDNIEKVLQRGFDAVAMARALVCEPDFINRMRDGQNRSSCQSTNYCIARMYSEDMICHKQIDDLPHCIRKELNICGQ